MVAGIVLELISNKLKFIVSAITGIIGVIFTILFVPGAHHVVSCPLPLRTLEGKAVYTGVSFHS